MEPTIIFLGVKTALKIGGEGFKEADRRVAQCAEEQGISKQEAWAGVRAEVRRRNELRLEVLLDKADPLGWRAAARAAEKPETTD